ncbi:MAG: hypothetical protein ACFFFG_01925 [Candidatus Thorarchaeota archaeon]
MRRSPSPTARIDALGKFENPPDREADPSPRIERGMDLIHTGEQELTGKVEQTT